MPTGSELLSRASVILQDADHVRWPLSELADWLNDSLRAIMLAKPSANSTTVTLSLVAGTLQSLVNVAHLALLGLPRNLTAAGPPRVGGRIIRPTARDILDASEPNWHNPNEVKYKKEVRQYIYDEQAPREFYVYPGNDGTGLVEALVSVMPTLLTPSGDPTEIASYSATIALPEPWGVAILDYVLYRAYSKDDMGADAGRSAMHFQAFASAVGIKVQVEGANSPNARARVSTT